MGMCRHERLDFFGVENPWQATHPTKQRCSALAPVTVASGGQALRHRVHRHTGIASEHRVAIEARDGGQAALDRRCRQPRLAVGDPHQLLRTRSRAPLGAHEVQYVLARHVGGLLADDPEEDAQVMGIGPHGVGPGPPRGELQELVDQLVAHPVLASAIGTHRTLKRRTPHHRTPPCRTHVRRRLPGRLVQGADHPYKCRTGRPQYRAISLLTNSKNRMAVATSSARRGGGGAAGRGRGGLEMIGKLVLSGLSHTIPEHIQYLGFEQRYVDRYCTLRVRAL